ncbi:MAG: permease-like cell division protein FtsX [Clostridiales bacterium]|nr:permease-like cell division protein FtsX [Clostridiales bacterium]MBR6254969.1 permease-like cell division protein FtsX [Clostridiales bacterium]MCR5274223.1 permease-like cell division protein FtsX [Clostridiales bacterium]
MSIRTFWNSFKEGVQGIIRHPLVTIASVSTILLMLLLMSVFFIFSANARFVMKKVGQQPPIEVYMKLGCTQEQMDLLVKYMEENPDKIKSYDGLSPEANYNRFRKELGDSASILDDFDYNTYMPYTILIQLTDPSYADDVVMHIQAIPGIEKVMQESNVMKFLTRATKTVNIATVIAFTVLFIISLFIISNMVRISVYSRSTEIAIMKFVGATNGYIRLPYVVEGALVGMVSALCAWGITYFAYSAIYKRAMRSVDPSSIYALLPMKNLTLSVLILCLACGVIIGSVGSGIAVRKYVKV